MKQKNIAILGSTGSIGCQTLDVVSQYPDKFRATVLVAGSRVDDLISKAIKYRPQYAIIADESKYTALRDALAPYDIKTATGQEAINDVMESDLFDTVVTATVGYSGLAPTLRAIKAGKKIALANKETLVVAGDIVTKALTESKSELLPIDSEHSAIYQCLVGEDRNTIKKIIITASGGPFRTFTKEQIAKATLRDALHHPNWSMGKKITIDSATLFNKGLEIMEASYLFDIPGKRISVLVHPESIVHSMVEFRDGCTMAQLSMPDMRLAIQYALTYPERICGEFGRLSLEKAGKLTFFAPDREKFPALDLAYEALRDGRRLPIAYNGANEVAVELFLQGKIRFTDIWEVVEYAMAHMDKGEITSLDDIEQTDRQARELAMRKGTN